MKQPYNFSLSDRASTGLQSTSLAGAWASLRPLLSRERKNITLALIAVIISSSASLFAPILIARVVDTAIAYHNFERVIRYTGILLSVYFLGLLASYVQTIRMGSAGRNVLFSLRNELFSKLLSLPVAFFNKNKSGDLISRINNDTDKLNQFFGQALMQFFGNFFVIIGAGILLLVLHPLLGIAALVPALFVLIVTQILSPWIRRVSRAGLQSTGAMSGEIQESLANFKVIVAFNRTDYFKKKFDYANQQNYGANVRSGIASNLFTPLYAFAANGAQLIVLGYGLVLVHTGSLTIGLLIGYLLYVTSFYTPLRQLASVWTSLQLALAALDRIGDVLDLESDLVVLDTNSPPLLQTSTSPLLTFDDVSFSYDGGRDVLSHANISLVIGKTYALVGPTGGGKTTTASLMARLFDPTTGTVYFDGVDIRTMDPDARTSKIGFILQEPYLFTGTIAENIAYGNTSFMSLEQSALAERIHEANLTPLLDRFAQGLSTVVTSSGEGISLGQRQLVAFMRAVLREPRLLILDEATANIDTVTEQLLEVALASLPTTTTKVIIAHRLNTIENADSILFINDGRITEAGSMENALKLIMNGDRSS